jgi:hypothetical protein
LNAALATQFRRFGGKSKDMAERLPSGDACGRLCSWRIAAMSLHRTLLAGLMLAFAVPAMADPAEHAKAVPADARWLAIQTADSARFDGKVLTLVGANPSVTLFTDRPYRTAEGMPAARFVGAWDKGGRHSFASKPPNADVSLVVDGKVVNAVVELSSPRIDGTTVSYAIKPIRGTLPASGKSVSLFIDDVCLSCW